MPVEQIEKTTDLGNLIYDRRSKANTGKGWTIYSMNAAETSGLPYTKKLN